MIAEKAFVCFCYQHVLFSFYLFFLKLVDKVDMDETSNEFEIWPDQIICLKSYLPLIADLKKPIIDFIINITHISFDRIVLKLADKVDIKS